MKPVFLYALYCGSLYGTERMALHTLDGLRDEFEPVLFAPPGEGALAEASRLGIQAVPFRNPRELALALRPWIARHDRIAFAATGVSHSLIFGLLNMVYRREAIHLHLIHGGSDEKDSYGRKKSMNGRDVRLIAVSDFVRERLVAHGVNPGQITVVGNFLPDDRIRSAPRRAPFSGPGVEKVVVVSRVEAVKRVSLVLDALDRRPELGALSIRILGTGRELDMLRERARRTHPNVVFEGFSGRVDEALAGSDLLLHTCAVEPFGLAILEAMAAGIPVLAPDRGGAAGLVEPGVSGFHFRADDAGDLATSLSSVREASAERLNGVVAAADARLTSRYSSSAGLDNYRRLFAGLLR
jgi:glycosyltransferase involved in cell wall biosynthesis